MKIGRALQYLWSAMLELGAFCAAMWAWHKGNNWDAVMWLGISVTAQFTQIQCELAQIREKA